MKVLLSGASGSFGSELIGHLKNFDVDTISLRYGATDVDQMSKLASCDVFIHCGALLNGKFGDLFNSNVLLTKNVLDYLSLKNPQVHFIYLSSMSVLQKKSGVSAYDYLNFRDMSDYALSKYLAEIVCSRYMNRIKLTVVRFSTLFHKDPAKDGLSKLVYDGVMHNKVTIFNDGVAKRDFVPLDIATQYVVKLVGQEKFFGETLNVVSGKEISFKEIVDFLRSKIDSLVIENKKDLNVIDKVASDFSCAGIYNLGEINFDLYERIYSYMEELRESVLCGSAAESCR